MIRLLLLISSITLCSSLDLVSPPRKTLRDVPPFAPDYCKNGGILVNGECQCSLRYEGKQCDREKCLNGGRRHKTNGKVKCHCPFGFAGERCENVTFCEASKGKLVNGRCECLDRWTGQFCHIRTCYNGIPTGGMEGFCLCDVGYTGPFCDEKLICFNGGSVSQDNECICGPGFVGDFCEDCAPGHHREGDQCVAEVSGHPLLSSSAVDQFPWTIIMVGGVSCVAIILIALSAIFGVRKWKTKPSRVGSAQSVQKDPQGQPATDV
ncbi:unnamed protein product, partial [Mesorhabditis belari]|uniref:EGF-like domain-containing protein n=1 Tax=Mesorhabditis belari TaxID=2138241 RepID=A0AAF3J4F0_9BILA